MLEHIVLLAQDTARYNRGLSFFQWGLTGMGVSVIMVGMALYFSKSKDSEKQTPQSVKRIALGVFSLIGLAIVAYAWLGYSPQ